MRDSPLNRCANLEAIIALEETIQSGHTTAVQAFFDADMDVNKHHALLNAIEAGHSGIVQMLLNAGADVNKHHTILSAIESGNLGVIQMLLNAGACHTDWVHLSEG
jgi:hypothetical protein